MKPDILEIIHRRIDSELAPRGPHFQQEYNSLKAKAAAQGTLRSSRTAFVVAQLCVDELDARGEIIWRLTRNSLSRAKIIFDAKTADQAKSLMREKLPPDLPDLFQHIVDSAKGLQNEQLKNSAEKMLRDAYDNLLNRIDSDIDLEHYSSQDSGETRPAPRDDEVFDVFICHASEDKDDIVRPLAESMDAAGLRVWYDEYTLRWGDRLRRSVDGGLAASKYGVVVLSPSFFEKEWPQRELDGLAALELEDGKKRILPVWHNIDASGVKKYSPTLGDIIGIPTENGIESITSQLLEILKS